jgi:hypothetical protein
MIISFGSISKSFHPMHFYARELVETVEDDMQMPYRLLAQPRIAHAGCDDLWKSE